MTETNQGSRFLIAMGIFAPFLYLLLYFLDQFCAPTAKNSTSKVCQWYDYNDLINTLLGFSGGLTNTVMPRLFIPYLIVALILNIGLLRSYLTLHRHGFNFLPRHPRFFRLTSGTYLGLGVIFAAISITATIAFSYMAIIFGAFWIPSNLSHPLDKEALAFNDAIILLGIGFFALVPLFAIIPYASLYKQHKDYLKVYHPKDKQHLFRTGVLIAILLLCLDTFLRQLVSSHFAA